MSAENGEAKSSEKSEKKELRRKICEQMEFYFSDSNLTKDRFLKKEITSSSEGYIDLNIFLRFNKLRLLTGSADQIAKALKHSTLLELDEQMKMVRRVNSFVEPNQKEIDNKTIYVENFSLSASNEEIKSYFSQFGTVNYISMPKFKTTNQFKGFAFIEFSGKNEAKQAVRFIKENRKAKTDEEEEEPIGKFPRFNAQIIELEKKINHTNKEILMCEQERAEKETHVDSASSSIRNEKENKSTEDEDQRCESGEPKEKRRKNDFSNLRAVSKKDWLAAKEQYLNKQKQEVVELKAKLARLVGKLEELKADKEKKKREQESFSKPAAALSDLDRGCIIKVDVNVEDEKSYESVFKLSRNQFKEKYMNKEWAEKVVYVDLDKHSNRVFVRFSSAQAAADALAVETEFLARYRKSLLDRGEEDDYFEKIASQRSKKLEKRERKTKRQQIKQEDEEVVVKKTEKVVEEQRVLLNSAKSSVVKKMVLPSSSAPAIPEKIHEAKPMAKKQPIPSSNYKPIQFVKASTRHIKFDDDEEENL